MLKETETEETIGFLSHFCHWWHFNWGVGLLGSPLATLMAQIKSLRQVISRDTTMHSQFENRTGNAFN